MTEKNLRSLLSTSDFCASRSPTKTTISCWKAAWIVQMLLVVFKIHGKGMQNVTSSSVKGAPNRAKTVLHRTLVMLCKCEHVLKCGQSLI